MRQGLRTLLLTGSCFGLVVAVPASAEYLTCDPEETFCIKPELPGKLSFTSPVTIRQEGDIPPNTEVRRPADELVVIRPDVTASLEDDNWMIAPFESGNHALSELEKEALREVVGKRPDDKIERITITGFADIEKPSKELQQRFKDNQLLSEARAKEAGDYIQTLEGLANVPITSQGKGNQLRLSDCNVPDAASYEADAAAYKECLGADRRVEVQVWYLPEFTPLDACNQQQESATQQLPFRISVDGQPVDALDVANSADATRCTDVALARADIQVKFDGLEVEPVLNINAGANGAVRGEEVTFTPYTNYAAFIEKAEVRIFVAGKSTQKEPLHVLEMNKTTDESVTWNAPTGLPINSLQYVLRVYDDEERFDETEPKILRLLDAARPVGDEQSEEREELIGYGVNHLHIQNIPVSGGSITVSGKQLAPGTTVQVMGRSVPVGTDGKFAYRQIVSDGDHNVNVVTKAVDGATAEFSRSLYIPSNDWFYVALGDLTVGKNDVDGPAALVTGEDTDRNRGKVSVDGRAAFYLKGKVKGDWLLTASADTQEQPIEDLFTGFTDKDPRFLLRRIDPNAYYPIYGDDSTTVEDAPTQGKFYVRLEKGDSQILWGNFKTSINGTELVNYSRGLYGANVQHLSEETTKFGERRTELDAFAADPGTVNSLEEFRGTGGSLYFLRGQDLVVGSERLRVETRDRDSGIVLATRYLVYGQDYELNYIQGRVILREALSSTSANGGVVRTGSLSGNPEFLVVDYEFSPSATSISNFVTGGHASHWVNDYVKLGVTAFQQNSSAAEQDLKGADLTLRYAPGTYLRIEAAKSKGPGDGAFSSQSGGFEFDAVPQTTSDNIEANAYRVETGIDFKEFSETFAGDIGAFILKREEGFSAPGQLTNEEVTQSGVVAYLPITDSLSLDLKGDYQSARRTGDVVSGEVAANYRASLENTLTFAIRSEDRELATSGGNSPELSQAGSRTDGAFQITHAPLNEVGEKERYEVYGLAQATLSRSGNRLKNNRIGAGGRFDLNDRVTLNGELTGGNGGLGALAGAEYRQSDRTTYYANYVLDNERTDLGTGSATGRSSNFTTGVKSRYSDSLSVFSEHRHQSFENGPSGLISAYGLDLAASDVWSFGGRFENGTLTDSTGGDTERQAISFSTGYHKEAVKYGGTAEWRNDDNTVNGKRTSWLFRNNLAYQTSEDWRLQAELDLAISNASQSAGAIDADFTEFTLAYAYRPVLNDRLNALLQYTYLDEQSTAGQLTPTQTQSASDFEQASHVFSVDAIYDLTPRFALGGKFGYRFGELRDVTIVNSQTFDSQAWLAIIRGDYHVVHSWDIVGELRYLKADEAGDARAGALVAIYRHVNENVKVGAGYNFTDFSDDLTDLDYSSDGPFLNLIGKF